MPRSSLTILHWTNSIIMPCTSSNRPALHHQPSCPSQLLQVRVFISHHLPEAVYERLYIGHAKRWALGRTWQNWRIINLPPWWCVFMSLADGDASFVICPGYLGGGGTMGHFRESSYANIFFKNGTILTTTTSTTSIHKGKATTATINAKKTHLHYFCLLHPKGKLMFMGTLQVSTKWNYQS